MEKKMPGMLKAVGILLLGLGILSIPFSFFLLMAGAFSRGSATGPLFVFIFGVCSIVVSIFILKLRNWARWISGALFLILLIPYSRNDLPLLVILFPLAFFDLWIVYYLLFSKKVREAFSN